MVKPLKSSRSPLYLSHFLVGSTIEHEGYEAAADTLCSSRPGRDQGFA